jgi:hypothetical protein
MLKLYFKMHLLGKFIIITIIFKNTSSIFLNSLNLFEVNLLILGLWRLLRYTTFFCDEDVLFIFLLCS